MDRYQRVEKPRPEVPIKENEIRITRQGMPRNYIAYATTLFRERNATEIVLKAMGNAISKTVSIAEIIKRRIPGLHQNTEISSEDITCTWEPLEEGLLPLETTRHVSMITLTLSTAQLDTTSPGYQPPLPADQVHILPDYEYDEDDGPQGYRIRGRGRGIGRGDGGWYRGRARGRGRGWGYSGRGGNYYGGMDQSPGNYNDYGPNGPNVGPRGRGRGRGRAYGNTYYDNGNFNDNMRGMSYGQQGRGGRGQGGYNSYHDYGYGGGDVGRQGRGRGRGRFGANTQDGAYNTEYGLPNRGRARGRGRGRGPRTQV
eukprot:TRINITY_DN1875_c0_g1_i1.p1 TRINITY_DN1875_c0_g1~~TRINITY_DN1875_c0_g1_i1.p1  ORF type:complete len:313 (+),score=50.77 TRINITY_DN1875_c0_g1_i1:404-1342(+)